MEFYAILSLHYLPPVFCVEIRNALGETFTLKNINVQNMNGNELYNKMWGRKQQNNYFCDQAANSSVT